MQIFVGYSRGVLHRISPTLMMASWLEIEGVQWVRVLVFFDLVVLVGDESPLYFSCTLQRSYSYLIRTLMSRDLDPSRAQYRCL